MNLTANQKRALRRLWSGDLDLLEIAEDLTFSTYLWAQDGEECEILTFDVTVVVQAARALGLNERPQVEIFVPTPEQIRVAASLIREQWTQREREERRKGAWLSAILENATDEDNDADGSTSPHRSKRDSADHEGR